LKGKRTEIDAGKADAGKQSVNAETVLFYAEAYLKTSSGPTYQDLV